MKTKLLKKISVATIAIIMSMAMAGCSEKKTTDADAPAVQLTEEEYIAKLEELNTSIEAKTEEIMGNVDPTDIDAVVEATPLFIEGVTPLYEELGGLIAPDKFAEAQVTIKDGTVATLEYLNLSHEMMGFETNTELSDDEKATRVNEILALFPDLQAKIAALPTALESIGAQQ